MRPPRVHLADLRRLTPGDKRLLTIVGIVALVGMALGLGWMSWTNAKLLRHVAQQAAVQWANVLKEEIDLDRLFEAGNLPPGMGYVLAVAADAGNVVRYRIFDSQGVIIAASEGAAVGTRAADPYFHERVARGDMYVTTKLDQTDGPAEHYAEAYVPIMDGTVFKGAVEVYVDIGQHVVPHRQTLRLAAAGLLALLLAATAVAGVVIFRNLLERQQSEQALRLAREQAEQANQAKTRFLAAMSHELRTPLNAIIGFSEIIKDETLGPNGVARYREYASDIYDSGQHLLEVISGILDLSKLESGMGGLVEQRVEVGEVVRTVEALVRRAAEQGGIALELESFDGMPALLADRCKLKQILANILSNAIKFTEPGGRVTLKGWCRADSGYVLQVRDTGIGIALADIPKALAPFQQIDGDLNRRYEGTGLGLPLAKSLVELHGGSLNLQSQTGIGTTVTLRFPAERIMHSVARLTMPGVLNSRAAEAS